MAYFFWQRSVLKDTKGGRDERRAGPYRGITEGYAGPYGHSEVPWLLPLPHQCGNQGWQEPISFSGDPDGNESQNTKDAIRQGDAWRITKRRITMDKIEKQMFQVINRNYDCRTLADKLNAISARRKKKGAKK